MGAKKKFYVVWKGKIPGVYNTWDECKKQIEGFQGAQYKSFPSKELADEAFTADYEDFKGKNTHGQRTSLILQYGNQIDANALTVDAACKGNPGIMEYRGVNMGDGKEVFRMGPYPDGTVNIGEFLALVHGLAMLKQQNSDRTIYSDSATAMSWVRKKKANTKLARTSRNAKLFEYIERAEKWLRTNQFNNKILKWNTKEWGEIPADFGRK